MCSGTVPPCGPRPRTAASQTPLPLHTAETLRRDALREGGGEGGQRLCRDCADPLPPPAKREARPRQAASLRRRRRRSWKWHASMERGASGGGTGRRGGRARRARRAPRGGPLPRWPIPPYGVGGCPGGSRCGALAGFERAPAIVLVKPRRKRPSPDTPVTAFSCRPTVSNRCRLPANRVGVGRPGVSLKSGRKAFVTPAETNIHGDIVPTGHPPARARAVLKRALSPHGRRTGDVRSVLRTRFAGRGAHVGPPCETLE